jgi:hypothetical protein
MFRIMHSLTSLPNVREAPYTFRLLLLMSEACRSKVLLAPYLELSGL